VVALSGTTRPTAADTGTLAPGRVVLSDRLATTLEAGDYEIVVRQTVQVQDDSEAGTGAQRRYGAAQRIRVNGPHLALDPSGVVASKPPAGGSGKYSTWLPHIVLADPTLPWQIQPADPPPAPRAPHLPADAPWLALLVLDGTEIDFGGVEVPPGGTGSHVVSVHELVHPPAGAVGPVGSASLEEIVATDADTPCSVVDVDLPAFRAIAPLSSELPWFAHTRDVDPTELDEFDVVAPGSYSVVVADRLPMGAPDGRYYVHLVSLEGCTGYLPDCAAPVGATTIRLVSLFSWTFTSSADQGDFAGLMDQLDSAAFQLPFSQGTGQAAGAVAAALSSGAVPLRYQTRFGDETFAWYRGPLQPVPLQFNPQPLRRSSAAGLSYDTASGIFDVTYGAAWELGRLLTLANGPVTDALVRWSRTLLRAARSGVARASLSGQGLSAAPAGFGDDTPMLHQALANGLLGGIVDCFGPRADPTGLTGLQMPGLLEPETLLQVIAGTTRPAAALTRRVLDPAGWAASGHSESSGGRVPSAPREGQRRVVTNGDSPAARPYRHTMLQAFLANPTDLGTVLGDAASVPPDIADWLNLLRQLRPLPAQYLVPHSQLLPQESLRFCYLDPNWTAALVDGALAVAVDRPTTAAVLAVARSALLPQADSATDRTTGVLLRSVAVTDWPGLRITAFGDAAGTVSLEPTRLERIAPDVILALFAGTLERLDVAEPAQHLHFGVGSLTLPEVTLRWIAGPAAGDHVGAGSWGSGQSPVSLRTDSRRAVVDLTTTANAIRAQLTSAYAPTALPPFAAAALAVQFLTASQTQRFRRPAPGSSDD
jgi:hypothetical protein